MPDTTAKFPTPKEGTRTIKLSSGWKPRAKDLKEIAERMASGQGATGLVVFNKEKNR